MDTLVVSPTRNLWDIHNLPDFISRSEALELIPKARAEFEDFVMSCNCEDKWVEFQVGDEFFDLNVWDEFEGDRRVGCGAMLYATRPRGSFRETDMSKDWYLFEADINLIVRYENLDLC